MCVEKLLKGSVAARICFHPGKVICSAEPLTITQDWQSTPTPRECVCVYVCVCVCGRVSKFHLCGMDIIHKVVALCDNVDSVIPL